MLKIKHFFAAILICSILMPGISLADDGDRDRSENDEDEIVQQSETTQNRINSRSSGSNSSVKNQANTGTSQTGTANTGAGTAGGKSICLGCHSSVPAGTPPHPLPPTGQQPAQGTSTRPASGGNIGTTPSSNTATPRTSTNSTGSSTSPSGTTSGGKSICLGCHKSVPSGTPPHPLPPSGPKPAGGTGTASGEEDDSGGTSNGGYKVLGWNNLGMHCMDADFSVFSILPPYNTIHAQVIDPMGRLLNGEVSVTYEAVEDPDGSINTTSAGKTNFWQYAQAIFNMPLAVDVGLPVPGPTSFSMPGAANTPQSMEFDADFGWFAAYGIPITPIDDSGQRNMYPLMRLTAKSGSAVLGSSDIVVPVSDEMDCTACHKSGSGPDAMPRAGWAFDSDPQRDFRLNILRLHDERELRKGLFTQALASGGFNAGGLYASVVTDGKPIMCAQCHSSEALPGSGFPGVMPLTQAIHTLHADVMDPFTNKTLEASDNRSACYRCHPGSETRCLRGAMGKDNSTLMQCQSCHGSMSMVGAAERTGWLDEPTCQSCHTGTAVSNNGQIRYASVFEPDGQTRQAVDTTFATNTDAPSEGLSLYRFSKGHGGLYCQACHGSTHAEFPTSSRNDNLYSINLQGHEGPLAECSTCHGITPTTVTGGPHGLHPIGQQWIESHGEYAEDESNITTATSATTKQTTKAQAKKGAAASATKVAKQATQPAASAASPPAGNTQKPTVQNTITSSQCSFCHGTTPSSSPPHSIPMTITRPVQTQANTASAASVTQATQASASAASPPAGNAQSQASQNTITSSQCSTCHGSTPSSSPPHRIPMTITRSAQANNGDIASSTQVAQQAAGQNGGTSNCQACHGLDYRGTVLSRAQADRVFAVEDFGTKTFKRGHQFGCYDCHNGPGGD